MFWQKNYCVNYARRLVYAPALPLLWSNIVKICNLSISSPLLCHISSPPSSLTPHPPSWIPYPSSITPPPLPPHSSSLLHIPSFLVPFPVPFSLLSNPSSVICTVPSPSPLLHPIYPLIPHPPPLTLLPCLSSLTNPTLPLLPHLSFLTPPPPHSLTPHISSIFLIPFPHPLPSSPSLIPPLLPLPHTTPSSPFLIPHSLPLLWSYIYSTN